MKQLSFFLIAINFFSCTSSRLISYHYVDLVSAQMDSTLMNLEKSSFAINNGKEGKRPFALVNDCDGITTIVFNYLENMPKDLRMYIKKSRRVIRLREAKIPVVFYFDDGSQSIRKGGIGFGIIGGYLIEFNHYGEVLTKGPVY